MKKTLSIFFPLFIICITIFANNSPQNEEKPYKIINDKSLLSIKTPSLSDIKTEKIRLKNDLSAYLISDPQATQSAASLSVPFGSWADAKEYPGIAHFLEHMLFNGTQKYPKTFEIMEYTADHNGLINAFTGANKTVYTFSVNNDAFIGGLDRFAQFYIAPLFDPSSIANELHAVDQEFAKNLEQDTWRWYHVSKENSNPSHPHVLFSTGNAETLKNIPREKLKKWYQNHYSANLMNLVVYSPLPLETLRKEISSLFGEVPNRKLKNQKIDVPMMSEKQKGQMTYIPTIKKGKTLLIQWELPKQYCGDKTKSADLICYALSRGHNHSLLENLKEEKLVEDLGMYTHKYGSENTIVELAIELTNEGADHIQDVMERFYETVAGLKKSSIPQYLYLEMKKMKTIAYEQQVREDPFRLVEKHASYLTTENFDTYPDNVLIPQGYSQENIDGILSFLSPENGAYYFLVEPRFIKDIPMDKTEKWMNIPYSIKPLAPSQLSKWKNISPNSAITLPSPNPFIPNDLKYVQRETSNNHSVEIANGERGLVYYHPASDYEEPNVSISLLIKSPLCEQTISHVMGDLFVQLAYKKLDALLLQARAGGIKSQISYEPSGISLEISGYSEKAPLLMQELLQGLKTLSFSKEDFSQATQSLSDSYENAQKELPFIQANEMLSCLIDPSMIANKEKFSLISQITYEDLEDFIESYFEFNFVEGFFTGNLTLKSAESLWLDVQDIIARGPYPKSMHTKEQFFVFPESHGPFFLQEQTDLLGTGIILAIDEGDFTFSKRAAQHIVSQVLKESFFNTLRGEQKTAYIAHSWPREHEKHLYQMFGVQSNTHDINDLLSRFEIFIDNFLQDIEKNIPQERFESLKKGVITALKAPPKNIKELMARQRLLAFDYDGDFEWMDKRIESTKELNYESFLKYVGDFLSRSNKKRVAIGIQGQLDPNKTFQYEVLSLENLKNHGSYLTR